MTDAEIAALPVVEPHGSWAIDWQARRMVPVEPTGWCWHWERLTHTCPQCADRIDWLITHRAA